LPGSEGATFPFWSPDGRSIGFFADGQLKTTDASGGPVQAICPAPQARGGSWSKNGVIIFAPSPFTGIFRVAATGGAPVPVTKLDSSRHEDSHRWPHFLPDGRHFLYLARTSDRSGSEIQITSIDKGEPVNVVHANGNPAYASSGFILYPSGNLVVAQPFDSDHLHVSGEPVTIADQVSANANVDRSSFSVSANGVLAYQRAIGEGVSELTWMDRSGRVLGKIGQPAGYLGPSLSKDGRKLAVEVNDPHVQANSDLWIYDLIRNSKTRLTFSRSHQHNRLPVWSPDGREVAFSSDRGGRSQQIYEKAASGEGTEQVLSPSEADQYPTSWSPDGHYIVGVQQGPQLGTQFLVLSMSGPKKTLDFLPEAMGLSRFSFPRVSPNGKWIAYSSFESGRAELYIASFPRGTGKWQVSTNGGRDSVWRRDGKELFYTTPFDDNLMSAEISEQNGDPVVGRVRPLFRIRIASSPHPVFDVSPDGRRFLINSLLPPSSPEPVTIVVNWDADLKRK
jgi:Tol biopolymer transport system component